MSYFDLLPPEILKYILLLTDRKTIKLLYELFNKETIKYMPSLDSILDERKLQYPRIEGFSFLHHIPKDEYIRFGYDSEEYHFKLPTKPDFRIEDAKRYFKREDTDLVKGDIIVFDKLKVDQYNKYIYNGINIVELDYKCYYADNVLPKEWQVIQNDVPIMYWYYSLKESSIVWFDVTTVLDQCMNNFKSVLREDGNHDIVTSFSYQKTEYQIVIAYINNTGSYDVDYVKGMSKIFKDVFLENGRIEFNSKLTEDELYTKDSNTLYCYL